MQEYTRRETTTRAANPRRAAQAALPAARSRTHGTAQRKGARTNNEVTLSACGAGAGMCDFVSRYSSIVIVSRRQLMNAERKEAQPFADLLCWEA
eukprot:1173484-Prymnesium_polylepis.1